MAGYRVRPPCYLDEGSRSRAGARNRSHRHSAGRRSPAKIASIGIHISRWVTTHGYALNVDLDPAPFNEWITACGLEDAAFTSLALELGRPVSVDEVLTRAAATLGEEFALAGGE